MDLKPLASWADLVLKSGEAILASAHAATVRANAPKVAVVPAADAPPPIPQPSKAKLPRSKAARANARGNPKGETPRKALISAPRRARVLRARRHAKTP
jgi:hypothetical protein